MQYMYCVWHGVNGKAHNMPTLETMCKAMFQMCVQQVNSTYLVNVSLRPPELLTVTRLTRLPSVGVG